MPSLNASTVLGDNQFRQLTLPPYYSRIFRNQGPYCWDLPFCGYSTLCRMLRKMSLPPIFQGEQAPPGGPFNSPVKSHTSRQPMLPPIISSLGRPPLALVHYLCLNADGHRHTGLATGRQMSGAGISWLCCAPHPRCLAISSNGRPPLLGPCYFTQNVIKEMF